MPKHWSEKLVCSCGMSFRSYAAEAKHRHNYPALCRPKRKTKPTTKTSKRSTT